MKTNCKRNYTMKYTKSLTKEIKAIIKDEKLDCSLEKFQDKVNWGYISECQNLSEEFIIKFQDKVYWNNISQCQNLSEEFIIKFQSKVYWGYISIYQNLSEEFIEKFKDEVNVNAYRQTHRKTTTKDKIKEIQAYAKKHKLEFDGKYLYAFRNHDKWGRGSFNKTLTYDSGYYYKDWHCDMRKDEENSFGMGIWPKGNTPVRVKVSDWGLCVGREDGKCRVWGFEVI